MLRRISVLAGFAALVVAQACSETATSPTLPDMPGVSAAVENADDGPEAAILGMMEAVNAALAAEGADYRVDVAEYYTAGDEAGKTVFFRDVGNKQLGHHWVPGDPRRGGGTNISYIVDQVDAAPGLPIGVTTAAIDRSMDAWQGMKCSEIPITQFAPIPALDLGVVQYLSGLGGAPFWVADLTHAGWLPLTPPILGVTFTFIWASGGVPTDIDNNGKDDTAFREIYYTTFPGFPWSDDGSTPFDVQTVAQHEAGHGLSQAHFGKLFRTDSNGKFHFAPFALMNAGYTGAFRGFRGTDKGGHCSIWGSWPNN